MVNEITLDEHGNCTVCGVLAHDLYASGEYPKIKCSRNNYYVLEYNESGVIGNYWDIRAAQSTLKGAMRFMDTKRVLVDVSKQPII